MEKIEKIEKGIYQGYLWYSNEDRPDVYLDKEVEEIILDEKENPFIVEGQLFRQDESGKYSYNIKYIDGEYFALLYKLNDLKDVEKSCHFFLPNRMKNVVGLNFEQYWRPVLDVENCEGMNVLQPAEFVFVGFKVKED